MELFSAERSIFPIRAFDHDCHPTSRFHRIQSQGMEFLLLSLSLLLPVAPTFQIWLFPSFSSSRFPRPLLLFFPFFQFFCRLEILTALSTSSPKSSHEKVNGRKTEDRGGQAQGWKWKRKGVERLFSPPVPFILSSSFHSFIHPSIPPSVHPLVEWFSRRRQEKRRNDPP